MTKREFEQIERRIIAMTRREGELMGMLATLERGKLRAATRRTLAQVSSDLDKLTAQRDAARVELKARGVWP